MNYLILLSEQADRLADKLLSIAIDALEYPHYADFSKTCKILEKANQRVLRRRKKAGLLFE